MIGQLLDHVGIVYRWRAAMRLMLDDLREEAALPAGYEVVPWDAARLPEVAVNDYLAYRGTVDGQLYHRYFSTPEGCQRMWREAIGGRFGRFDAERTLLLVKAGVVCGDVMASEPAPMEGVSGNLAVHPPPRGR